MPVYSDYVSLATAQAAFPDLTTAQNADLPAIISAATYEIATRYPKAAPRATFDETHDPGYSRIITLTRRPVLRVNRVRADLVPILSVQRTGACRRASVEVVTTGDVGSQTVTGLKLHSEIAGVPQSDVSISFGTYVTVGQVAAQINATGTWTATVNTWSGGGVQTDLTSMASADLEPMEGPKEAVNTQCPIYGFSRDLADWHLTSAANGELMIYEYKSASYQFPERTWGFDPRSCGYRINYDAGLSTVTPDIIRAAIIVIGDLIEQTDKTGPVRSQRDADYSYQLGDPTYKLPDAAARILSVYRNRRLS